MRAFKTKLAATAASMVAAALLMSGCSSTTTEAGLTPIDLKDQTKVSQLCGSNAAQVLGVIKEDAAAKETSQKRKDLSKWGLEPLNTDQITAAETAVEAQAKLECGPDGKPAALSAEQLEAAKVCLNADEQKALKPGPDVNDKIIVGCRAIGKAKFDGLAPENKGDVSTKASYAWYAKDLAEAKDITVARYDTAILIKGKEDNDRGVKTDNPASASKILATFPGATQDDIAGIGTHGPNAVNFDNHTIEKGGQVFLSGADRILRTKEDIAAFFAEDSDAARAAKDHVTKAIKDAGYGDREVARAMNGLGYIPIQLKGASQTLGTSYFSDGKVKILDQWRQSRPGDVYWLFETEDGMFIPEATLRADCGNVNLKMVRMVREDTPAAVGVSHGPGEEVCAETGKVPTSTGECLPPAPPVCTSNCGNTPPCVYDCVGHPVCTINCTPVQNCTNTPTLPECLTPKSNNIQDYQRPGTDNTTDSGTGVKPPVTANQQPDQAPPPVVTSQTGGGGVVDNSAQTPGTQTGGTAPGVTAPEPQRSSPPPAEPGVNGPAPASPAPGAPAEGGNTGTITNPFG